MCKDKKIKVFYLVLIFKSILTKTLLTYFFFDYQRKIVFSIYNFYVILPR